LEKSSVDEILYIFMELEKVLKILNSNIVKKLKEEIEYIKIEKIQKIRDEEFF
jgi:hypothetical protein